MATMRSFIQLATDMPADISVIVEGDHGIGKSQAAYQIAELVDLPVKELRLALMSDGDFIGLPEFVDRPFEDPEKEKAYQEDLVASLNGIEGKAAVEMIARSVAARHGRQSETRFAPPSWLIDVQRTPHVLFLDEVNRAMPEVMQASFQLVLQRNLNGHYVHPDTRIIAAVNTGNRYRVTGMDPALLDRFARVRLEPTLEDWLLWAKESGKIHPIIRHFISQEPQHLEHIGDIDSAEIYPSRRSWELSSRALTSINAFKGKMTEDKYARVLNIVQSICGIHAAQAFMTYLESSLKAITVEDIIKNWDKVKDIIDPSDVDALNALNDKLVRFVAEKEIKTDKQAQNVGAYLEFLPAEIRIAAFCDIMKKGDHSNVFKISQHAAEGILTAVAASGVAPTSTASTDDE